MQPLDPKLYGQAAPERKIQSAIEDMLRRRGWYVVRTHGNTFQSGLPDDFATRLPNIHRWIEIKLPHMQGSRFTPAQLKVFPELCKHGSGVWVLTAATEEEYNKLYEKCNWYKYLPEYVGRGV